MQTKMSSAIRHWRIKKTPDNQKFLASDVFRLLPAEQMCTLKKIPQVTPQYIY